MKAMGTIDRYVLKQWLATFALSTLGIPAVAVLIRLSENYGKLADASVPGRDILLGFALLYPGQMAMLFPAGVLFATVFTLNAMGRHSELTAVKACGVSFYRLIAPMLVLASIAMPVNYALNEVAALGVSRQRELHHEKANPNELSRSEFGFQATNGWTWAVKELQRGRGYLRTLLLESPASDDGRWTIAADSARWDGEQGAWVLYRGVSMLSADSGGSATTITFRSMRSPDLVQHPDELVNPRSMAEEMRVGELREYLDRLQRTGERPGMLAVDLPLKFAVPVACLVVALFGAPLAVTNPRAGAALGLAIALGTTLVYLTGTQIMKAIGGKELISPDLAAWSMNGLFLAVAIVLLIRVKS
jgi:lipopolysaccharide export system permease protein